MSFKSRSTGFMASSRKEDPLVFQVIPDVGLKNDQVEFILGMPLNQVISLLQQNVRLVQQIQLRFSRKDPFGRDVCIYLSADGIRLFFHPVSQILRLIEIDNLTKIILKYGKSIFSEPGAEASMERVNEFFGSTHPGAYDEKQKMYVQSWPGLSFCFPTDASENIEVAPGFGPNLRSLKYDPTSQPRLTKMSIYRGNNLSQPECVDVPLPCYCGQNMVQLVESVWKDDRLAGLKVTFDTQTGARVDGDLEVMTVTKKVFFGDTVSAVQSALGAPSKVFYKSDDKMKIHRGATKETLVGQPHFFFNYFSMGLDVLFDFASKRVIKFVLHTNVPGHPDFAIYSRCLFSIQLADDVHVISTNSKFDEFSASFCDASISNTVRPVVLQRHEQHPFGPTFCYGIHQIVVEVMENGSVAALTLYDDKL